MKIAVMVLVLFAIGCSTVGSSLQYTEGTKAVERGDHEAAVGFFREAVRLEPGFSRNHNNLAASLFELGRVDEGWPHVRKAVQLDNTNVFAAANSKRYIIFLLERSGLDTGSKIEEVRAALGNPDDVSQIGECLWYQYGFSAICFKSGVFTSIGDMRRK